MTESPRQLYRRDIDGLRALAVLLVLGFHGFPEWVPGGFVGVDVFFVISGFLITGIILAGLEEGTFRASDFYARRARRIFPSLVVVSGACMVLGWYALLPDEYAQLGKHIVAGAAFLSNFALWRETGYFDTAADTKPLLHLWSLGIEEQFYLVWPLFVSAMWTRPAGLLRSTLWVSLGSFTLCIALLGQDAAATFYLPVTRLWELLAGGLLACISAAPTKEVSSWPLRTMAKAGRTQDLKSLAGLALIGVSVGVLDRLSAFPGWAALPPVAGAWLILSAGPAAWVNRVLLSARSMVWIGLISFPLYLWHWPLLTLARIVNGDAPSANVRLLILFASLLLASATYLFVERPIRFARRRALSVVIAILGLLGAGLGGATIYFRDGFPSRFADQRMLALLSDLNQGGWGPTSDRQISCPEAPGGDGLATTICRLSSDKPPSMALLGDSHAKHLFPGLAEMDGSRTWLLLTRNGCPPVRGITIDLNGNQCDQFGASSVEKILRTPSIDTVVLSFLSTYVSDTILAADHVAKGIRPASISSKQFPSLSRDELFYLGLNDVVSELEQKGKRVVVFLDIPELPFFPRDCLRRSLASFSERDPCTLAKAKVLERQAGYRALLLRLAASHPTLRIFDSVEFLCVEDSCAFRNEEMLLYVDSYHLSLRGSAWMAERFLRWLAAEGPPQAQTSRPVSPLD